jgi:PAS domain S-box-containing protein
MTPGNAAACQHDHLVLFYESDDFLVDGVCAFLVPALRNGDAAIVVATAAHRVAFEAALLRAGVDVDAATREGRYAAFDAADLLSHLMVDGAPDAKRFEETIGTVVDYVSHEHREVRVYGELAAPLCDREDSASAVVLEGLWNDLAVTRDFELLCAYPMRSFDDAGATAFKRICERYTSVIPGESSRAIARLRQGPTSPTHDREMLRRSESVINAAGDGIFGINAQGRITIANPAAADMIGYAVHELAGHDLHDLVHHTKPDGSPYPVHECQTHAALADGAIHRCDTDVYWRKDGGSFAVEYTATPIVQDGRTSGAVVVFRDITDRREAERVKDQFTAIVSHELRTPLTSIRASLGLLESGALGPLPERGRRMVQIAVKNTDRLVRLINDILDLARIESGSVHLHRGAVRRCGADGERDRRRAPDGHRGRRDAARRYAPRDPRRRRRPSRPDPDEPHRQRRQVLAGGQQRADHDEAARSRRAVRGHRPRTRDPRRQARDDLRALRAGRRRGRAAAARHRPRPRDLPQHRRATRRAHLGAQHARAWQHRRVLHPGDARARPRQPRRDALGARRVHARERPRAPRRMSTRA